MRTTTPLYRMADRLAGGELEQVLADMRAQGFSYDEISRRLYANYGIEVTRQTVANWLTSMEPAA